MGHPVMGIMALVISTALLVWVCEKTGNPAQKMAKWVAWVGITLSALLLIGQLYICGSMCKSGQCMRMMKGGMGMGMMQGMTPPSAPPAQMPETGK